MKRFISIISGRIVYAVKQNFLPGIILQLFALLIIFGYYYLPAVNSFFGNVGQIKQEYGYWYSAISTCFFGGLLPFLILSVTGQVKKGLYGRLFLFYVLFWFWKGIEVDFFYRLQGEWFGEAADGWIVAKKVFVDQFVYNPVYAAPCVAIFYLWKEVDFSLSEFYKNLNREFFFLSVPTMLVSIWLVWVPTTAIVYSFPSALQIPLFNIALCFFVLLITFLKPDDISADKQTGERCDR